VIDDQNNFPMCLLTYLQHPGLNVQQNDRDIEMTVRMSNLHHPERPRNEQNAKKLFEDIEGIAKSRRRSQGGSMGIATQLI
jgi:hypothetical protein